MPNLRHTALFSTVLLTLLAQEAMSQELEYLEEDIMFTSATGTAKNLREVPAVFTLITARDIERSGARELDQVLKQVPGLHIARTSISTNPSYVVRGDGSTFFNQKVLVMIDGISITQLFSNNRGTTWGGMPLQMIERIEIVRGPGSAVYGADAFSGVINIITKNYKSLDPEAGALAGSNDTAEVWALSKGKYGDLKATFSAVLTSTDGNSGVVEADAATTPINNVSNAPGELNLQRDSIESRLSLATDSLQFRLGYQGHSDVGTGAGHANALDPSGSQDASRINGDLTHSFSSPSHTFELTSQLSVLEVKEDVKLQLFPRGFAGLTDGLVGEPFYRERHTRFEVTGIYNGFEKHTLRVGSGASRGKIYDVSERKNFDSNGIPLGQTVQADESLIYILPQTRNIEYLYLQDEWLLGSDWSLTGGIRYDRYSDFGDTFNWRTALIWRPTYDFTAKFLYGTAFRPPSFADLYLINNPVSNGNPDLEPETVDTFELALTYQLSHTVRWNLNLFHNTLDNLIETVLVPGETTLISANAGMQTGYGFESELFYELNHQWELQANMSWHSTVNENTNEPVGNSPVSQAYLSANFETGSHLFWGSVNWVGKQERSPGDMRSALDSYSNVRLHYQYDLPLSQSVGFVVNNAFDANIRYAAAITIPQDLPGPERSMEVYYRYAW